MRHEPRDKPLRLVLLSDTHTMLDMLAVPDGDVLIHCGDFCVRGTPEELSNAAAVMRELPHRHKIVVAGNHDRILEVDREIGPQLFAGSHYLLDSGVEIEGLKFWGSPWQPEFLSWAFNLPRGAALRAKWDMIPEGTDVLVTHGPPMGVLDRTISKQHVGCEELRAAVARVRPRLHVFGHIHEGYGAMEEDGTLFVNSSSCTVNYAPTNRPVVVEVGTDGEVRVV